MITVHISPSLADQFIIDFDSDLLGDEVIPIVDTLKLCAFMDGFRASKGYRPMFPFEGYKGAYDTEGWYDFHIPIENGRNPIGKWFGVVVSNSESTDNEVEYKFSLSEEMRAVLLHSFNEQCLVKTGKSLMENLREDAE